MTPHKKWNHSFVQFFLCWTLQSWYVLIIFRICVIETKLDIVSVDDKNLQRRRKVVGQRDLPIQNSYTSYTVQCLSHSRDPKFVTSLVQSAIIRCKERHAIAHAVVSATNARIYYGKFSVHSNNRRWMDISKILGHFGCESCCIFHRQSSIASRLYFQFREAIRWCICGFIS